MPRKISLRAAESLIALKPFCRSGHGRTSVFVGTKDGHTSYSRLLLHGNCIAQFEGGKLSITTAGWNTVTTRERLKSLPGVDVYQRKGVLHLNGKEWDGAWTEIT